MGLPVFFNKIPLRIPAMAWFVATPKGVSDFFNRIRWAVQQHYWLFGSSETTMVAIRRSFKASVSFKDAPLGLVKTPLSRRK